MEEMWNKRYADKNYVYGTTANEYFREKLLLYKPGKILMTAEGEGRNGVFAAVKKWDVFAFDISSEGKKKAEQLASRYNVKVNYEIKNIEDVTYPENHFDCIAMIYSHFDSSKRSSYFNKIIKYLKPNGVVIFEAFSKNQIKFQKEYNSGGPSQESLLYSVSEIKTYFKELHFSELSEQEVILGEGEFHKGKSSVIRFVGTK
ncbi:MAG: hypothetical protein A2033_13585 [Bacteroidetes bacterium GWA2_31_9]|nr:MAG: hypothetical protein A2033_13585 [Bacteroidetes bacterium GWA2_31_9]